MRRIFVSIGLSQGLQKEILEWGKSHSELRVRWLQDKNLHITLVPPWYDEDIPSIIKKLEGIMGIGAFDIEFNNVSFGPDKRHLRLIWAEGEAPQSMIYLKTEAEKVLNKEPEHRPFRLHLTVARFRPENFSSFPEKELNEKVFWRDTIKAFLLMESHLSKNGADYSILKEFIL